MKYKLTPHQFITKPEPDMTHCDLMVRWNRSGYMVQTGNAYTQMSRDRTLLMMLNPYLRP